MADDGDSAAANFGGKDWPVRLERMADDEPSPRRAALHRLAAASRRVIHAISNSAAEDELLERAASELEAIAARFDEEPSRDGTIGWSEAANSGNPYSFFDHSPILGRANPLAPPVHLHSIDERTVEGRVVCGPAYEGPPAHLHGGYIAAIFDEILGTAQCLSGLSGMTGRMTVTYRSPTPLFTELRFRGTFDRREGRKVFTTGTVHAGDRLCAEAEAVFIALNPETIAHLRG